jgi:hypothetical protein
VTDTEWSARQLLGFDLVRTGNSEQT